MRKELVTHCPDEDNYFYDIPCYVQVYECVKICDIKKKNIRQSEVQVIL